MPFGKYIVYLKSFTYQNKINLLIINLNAVKVFLILAGLGKLSWKIRQISEKLNYHQEHLMVCRRFQRCPVHSRVFLIPLVCRMAFMIDFAILFLELSLLTVQNKLHMYCSVTRVVLHISVEPVQLV